MRGVVERGGEKRLRVVNLKVVYGSLVNACNERGGREVGQKKELGSKKAKLLLECTNKKERKKEKSLKK
jgi:hypothetical protein